MTRDELRDKAREAAWATADKSLGHPARADVAQDFAKRIADAVLDAVEGAIRAEALEEAAKVCEEREQDLLARCLSEPPEVAQALSIRHFEAALLTCRVRALARAKGTGGAKP